MKNILFLYSFLLVLNACVKDEQIDFPPNTTQSISLFPTQIPLLIGQNSESINIEFSGFSEDEKNETQTWHSSNIAVADVSNGIVTAIAEGQAFIHVVVNDISSDSVMVSVASDMNSIVQVDILNEEISILIDSTLQFNAQALNINNEIILGSSISWTSSNPTVATIDADGLLSALALGSTDITASVDGINSLKHTIEVTDGVSGISRMGTFSPNGSYTINGTTTLTQVDVSTLELSLSEDFETSSGPALYIYLASTNSGTIANGSNGLRVSNQLTGTDLSGARTYTISTNDASLDQFDYVLVYCEPFGIIFGSATLD